MLRKLVVLAAGQGTRLRPITGVVAKELLPIIDTPVIDYVLQEALIPSINEVILLTRKNKQPLIEYIKSGASPALKERLAKVSLRTVFQEDRTSDYGTGAALLAVAEDIGQEPFLLVFADSFGLPGEKRLEDMARVFEKHNQAMAGVILIMPEQLRTYGIPKIFYRDGRMFISEILEKPDYNPNQEFIAIPGAFILKPDIWPDIESVEKDKNGEVPFTSALNSYCRRDELLGHPFTGHFFETGNRVDIVKAIIQMSLLREDTAGTIKSQLIDLQKNTSI